MKMTIFVKRTKHGVAEIEIAQDADPQTVFSNLRDNPELLANYRIRWDDPPPEVLRFESGAVFGGDIR